MADPNTKVPLRIAFLGCGFATRLHSRTLRGFADVSRYYASRDSAPFDLRYNRASGSVVEACVSFFRC